MALVQLISSNPVFPQLTLCALFIACVHPQSLGGQSVTRGPEAGQGRPWANGHTCGLYRDTIATQMRSLIDLARQDCLNFAEKLKIQNFV